PFCLVFGQRSFHRLFSVLGRAFGFRAYHCPNGGIVQKDVPEAAEAVTTNSERESGWIPRLTDCIARAQHTRPLQDHPRAYLGTIARSASASRRRTQASSQLCRCSPAFSSSLPGTPSSLW